MLGDTAAAIRQVPALKPSVETAKRNRASSSTRLGLNEEDIFEYDTSCVAPHVARLPYFQESAAETSSPADVADLPIYVLLRGKFSANASYSSCFSPELGQSNTSTWVILDNSTPPQPDAPPLLVERLQAMKSEYPAMSAQFEDAILFAKLFDDGLAQPAIWTDNETEVVLEWMLPKGRHAVVSFEGDSEFGYALRFGDKFVPGEMSGLKPFRLPDDLSRYLLSK
jgi:hypothetical protein